MTAINFPSSPVNGATLTSGNTTYTYNAAKTRWDAVTTVNGIQLNSLSIGAEAPASGDGGIAYNSNSGVFTYTPPVSADPLPAQTGNTGKYLTTDGSTTSWAAVASGASYEIGDGLELNSVSTTSWPISPNLVTTINGVATNEGFGRAVKSTSQYTVVGRNNYSKVTIHNTSTGALLHTINNPDTVAGFGVYLDISGDNIAIAHGYSNKVFIYSASTGSLVRTFTNPGSFNNFGVTAKIEGNIVAIASFGPTAGNYDGYLHVYDVNTGALLWQKANPNTDGGTTDDAFRAGLAVTANYIALGATDADTGGSNSGIVYIFDKNTGDVVRTISAPSPAVNLRFGSYLDMDGTNLVVATNNNSLGLVYLFDILTGNLLASVPNPGASDGSAADAFAYVALDGDYLAVGAYMNDVGGNNSGSAYLFNISNLNSIATVYSLHGISADAYFGMSLSLSQGFLSIGEYNTAAGGTSRGSVRIYAADVTTNTYLQPDNTIATTSYVDTAITNLVDSSPTALNTLNELAAALGDDANFSTTVTTSIASKAPLASPAFTGVPVAPTAIAGNASTQIATTAFVAAAVAGAGGGATALLQDFTASGSITQNTPVAINASGSVAAVAQVAGDGATAVNYGFQYSEVDGSAGNGISYSAATDQFIAYQYPGKLKVGKFTTFPDGGIQWGDTITLSNQGLSGNFATWRARSVYDSTLDRDLTVVYRADTDKIGFYQGSTSLGTYNYSAGTYTESSQSHSLSYSQWGPQFAPVSVGAGKVLFMYRAQFSNNPTINIATTSLNSGFTFGSPVTLSGQAYANQTTCGLAYSETAGVAYALYVDGSNLKYAIINITGSSPVIESTHMVQEGIANPSYVGGIAIKDNYVVVTYVDRQPMFNFAKVVGGYIDSATKQITFGTDQRVMTNDIGRGGLTVIPTKFNNFAVLRTEDNTYTLSNYSVATDGEVTEIQSTAVTTDSTYVSQSGAYNLVFSPISNNLVVDFYVETGTSYGITGHRNYQFSHKAEIVAPTTSNANTFIGYANASAADSQTVSTTLSGVQTGLSGLTPGTEYYITATGGLSTTDTGYRKIGIALSSTSLLVR